PVFSFGVLGINFGELFQKRGTIHSGMGGRFHVLLFTLGPFGVPSSELFAFLHVSHRAGANERCAGVAELFECELAGRRLGIRRRRNCESDWEKLLAVNREHLLGRDSDLGWFSVWLRAGYSSNCDPTCKNGDETRSHGPNWFVSGTNARKK